MTRRALGFCVLAGFITSCATVTEQPEVWSGGFARVVESARVVTWQKTNGLVQELFYESEHFKGKPIRVFAWISLR